MHPEMYPENPNTTKRRSREKKERLEKEEERAMLKRIRKEELLGKLLTHNNFAIYNIFSGFEGSGVIEQERDDAIERAERGE